MNILAMLGSIPTWFWGALAGCLFGLAAVVGRSMFSTVRRATIVVTTNDSLRETVQTQKDCIEALEQKVNTLLTENVELRRRIAHLEHLVEDATTLRDIKHRRIAAANEDQG